jgi:hypothetical protein
LLEEALRNATGAILLMPKWEKAHFRRGMCHERAGETQLAHNDFVRAEQLCVKANAEISRAVNRTRSTRRGDSFFCIGVGICRLFRAKMMMTMMTMMLMLMMLLMVMLLGLFGQLGLWLPSSGGARHVHTTGVCFHICFRA